MYQNPYSTHTHKGHTSVTLEMLSTIPSCRFPTPTRWTIGHMLE